MRESSCLNFFFFLNKKKTPKQNIMFTLYKAQEPLGVESYRVRGTVYRDMWETMVDPRLEQVKIVIEEASSWESIPQSSGSSEEASQVELTFHQWNTKGIRGALFKCKFLGGSNQTKWTEFLLERVLVGLRNFPAHIW